ncbi:MAG TPA: protein kinase [Nakamurella sp.]|nr:protein kinase [Nakamurella sp.]
MTDVGELIAGRYRLVDRIAVGGMGVVWEGWDELLARRVAVKQVLIQPGLSEADALLARYRVIREARITARLHHPHAVTIYDVVDDGDYPCLIMQFVPSSSLTGLLRERGTMPPSQVGRIGADLASALHAAHEVGIVHRDVKPGNVLITDDGSAKLTDFGISHAAGDATLTSTGMVSGTPAYLAPEVARGGTSGFPADVFSLGATMYAALEGTPPFGLDPNPMAVLHRVASGQMIPPQRSGALTPLLLRMMAPAPADRPTMSEVSRTLTLPPTDATGPAGSPPGESLSARTVPVSRSDLTAAEPRAAEPRAAEPRAAEPRAVAERKAAPRTRSSAPVDSGRRRPPTSAVVAVVGVVLAAALTAGFFVVSRGDGGQATVAATSVQDQAGIAASQSPQSPSPSTDSDQMQATSEGSQAAESAAAEPAAAGASEPAAELAAAVSGYYALMPANTDAGWALLTPSFQSGIAQDREYYNSFWSGVQRVVATDVTGTPPDTAEATITYYFTDGRVPVERTAYRLVRDGGVLKIDSSSVLSSSTG